MTTADASTEAGVFISYSHHDEAWKNKLLPHLRALEQAGLNMVVWEDRQIDAGAKWHPAIEQAMAEAAVAVLLISADYLASNFCIKEEVPFLLKRQEQAGMLLIPVLIRKCAWKTHRWLADRQMLPCDGKCVVTDFPGDPDAVFSEVAERVSAHLKRVASTPQASSLRKAIKKLDSTRSTYLASVYPEPRPASKWPAIPDERVDLTRLPETGAALFGRDEELRLLDQAWSSGERPRSGKTPVVAFVAYGGVGKSTLINEWLREMQRDRFRGATRVFGWSFYSRGASEEGTVSADAFVDAALRFFGDPDPTIGSSWDKGERLARLVGRERALLVLDGMEPLQNHKGEFRDPALESLLRGLTRRSNGLCLITTREPLVDMAGLRGVVAYDLEQISAEAGRALLRTERVVGTDAELEALAKRFGLHALTLSLLGVYLYEKDRFHGIGCAQVLEPSHDKEPINRVLVGIEQWLANTPELEVVRMLALFDRPVDAGCLRVLRAKPAIPGLTERTPRLAGVGWQRVLSRLERLRLIQVRHKDSSRPVFDTHPLVREHFAAQLREANPTAWREGHRRLYNYLTKTASAQCDTLHDLTQLCQAVRHGCEADLHREAFVNVYVKRIDRGGHFSVAKLGASATLDVLRNFFERPWTRPVSGILGIKMVRKDEQAWLLNEAAYCLRALGKVKEALEPSRVALRLSADSWHWHIAAVNAVNLSELEMILGNTVRAKWYAQEAVEFSENGAHDLSRVMSRDNLADSLHQRGNRRRASRLFDESKTIQKEQLRRYVLPDLCQRFRYHEFLMAGAERASWRITMGQSIKDERSGTVPELIESCARAEACVALTLPSLRRDNHLVGIALDQLSLARAALYKAIVSRMEGKGNKEVCGLHAQIDAAVEGLRRAGRQDELPKGLLTHAWLRALEGRADDANATIEEAWQIAERGSMRLFMADIHLYRARLFRNKEEIGKARTAIEQCGYWRRRVELEDAEEAAKNWSAA